MVYSIVPAPPPTEASISTTKASLLAPPPPEITATPSAGAGSCAQWLAEAGVTDITDAMLIINHESGCNPLAVNSSSGACNIAQELPCGKSGCALGDGACDIVWMSKYVMRYGGWAGAASHEEVYGWY